MRNVFKCNAWYIKAYNLIPEFLRPAYCFTARVQHNTTDYCHFVMKYPAVRFYLGAAIIFGVSAFFLSFTNVIASIVALTAASACAIFYLVKS